VFLCRDVHEAKLSETDTEAFCQSIGNEPEALVDLETKMLISRPHPCYFLLKPRKSIDFIVFLY